MIQNLGLSYLGSTDLLLLMLLSIGLNLACYLSHLFLSRQVLRCLDNKVLVFFPFCSSHLKQQLFYFDFSLLDNLLKGFHFLFRDGHTI